MTKYMHFTGHLRRSPFKWDEFMLKVKAVHQIFFHRPVLHSAEHLQVLLSLRIAPKASSWEQEALQVFFRLQHIFVVLPPPAVHSKLAILGKSDQWFLNTSECAMPQVWVCSSTNLKHRRGKLFFALVQELESGVGSSTTTGFVLSALRAVIKANPKGKRGQVMTRWPLFSNGSSFSRTRLCTKNITLWSLNSAPYPASTYNNSLILCLRNLLCVNSFHCLWKQDGDYWSW